MDDQIRRYQRSYRLIRACQSTRLQSQVLAQAYQQICPQARCPIHGIHLESDVAHPDEARRTAAAGGTRTL